jgi:ketosteroid isomerase-like protein
MTADALALADRLVRAIEGADEAAIRAVYAPEARIWHNFDNKEQTVDENLRVLRWMTRILSERHYRVLRREAFPGGFVQQHVLEGALPDGQKFELAACLVCSVENGRITRLDEYLDSAATKSLQGFAARRQM